MRECKQCQTELVTNDDNRIMVLVPRDIKMPMLGPVCFYHVVDLIVSSGVDIDLYSLRELV